MSQRSSWFALLRSILLAAMLVGLAASQASGQPPAGIGGPFALIDQNGRIVTDRDLRGRYLLIYFGETSCSDLCPETVNKLAQVLHLLETRGAAGKNLRAVFITIDPERDSPATIGSFTRQFSPKIVALTGTPAAISKVAAEYHVTVLPREEKRGEVEHSERFYLVGPDGRVIQEFSGNVTAATIAGTIGAVPRTE